MAAGSAASEPADAAPPATGPSGVRGVSVRRDGRRVIEDLTLLAEPGELVVVLGPSGAGKTTLLRAVAGLETVERGDVLIDGRRVNGLSPARREVSMVFERAALVPFLDVADNLAWGPRQRREPEATITSRVADRARTLGLGRLLRRRPDEISHGQRGTVGLGRALVATPRLFLLDEPLAALDPGSRTAARRHLVDHLTGPGPGRSTTTLWATHDQAEAMAVAHRIAVLDGGRLVQFDEPLRLYRRPADLLVASLLGAEPMGFVPARAVASGALAGFLAGRHVLPLWSAMPRELAGHEGRRVVLGVRAESVGYRGRADAAGRPGTPEAVDLPATVTAVELVGPYGVVTASVDVASLDDAGAPALDRLGLGAAVRCRVPVPLDLRPGDPVTLSVDPRRVHVFDADTGRALWHAGD